MSTKPSLVFIPGSWHKPSCYEKLIKPLEDKHGITCISVTLPSTQDNPKATFKDDIDAARDAIRSQTGQGRDVIVIAHSYGGMVGNSAIKGLARPKSSAIDNTSSESPRKGYITGLILIASGFTITGLAFLDPFFGIPPPFFRADKESGYAVLVADPLKFFYHDVPATEAEYWVSQLTTQSWKSLSEGGEHAYAGWQDVPTWYVGTIEDVGLPVVAQRVQVGTARACGATVYHKELPSSHSPFLSMPDEVIAIILEAVGVVSGGDAGTETTTKVVDRKTRERIITPAVKLGALGTWFRFGLPYLIGRVIGWGAVGFIGLRRLWRR